MGGRAWRLDPPSVSGYRGTLKKVQELAALEGRTYAEMVRILTEEAIKTREFPDITFVAGPSGRRAAFRTGPDVWEVLEPYVLADRSWEALSASYEHLSPATLHSAVRYYDSYPEEIDARIAANQAG
jgi:uncharacterized protein (DUF433 family)